MIESLLVNNFRGIKSSRVDDCRRINLFFGKNNCGKTTLLESIFLLSGQSNPSLPLLINAFRGYTSLKSESDLNVDFYNLDTTIPITISSYGELERKLSISMIKSFSKTVDIQSVVDANSHVMDNFFGLKLLFDENKSSEVIIKKGSDGQAKMNIAKQYTEPIISELLHPRMVVGEFAVQKLTKVITSKQKDNIISIMRLIDNRITDIIVANGTIMVDIGADQFLPVNVMGDGMVKILLNILTIYECAGGIALIDEVDNGLHYSMMPNLWRAMIKAAIENNVQIFTTTHSMDSIQGLNSVISEFSNEREILSAYKLVKTSDDILTALRYDKDTLNYMINQEIEVR